MLVTVRYLEGGGNAVKKRDARISKGGHMMTERFVREDGRRFLVSGGNRVEEWRHEHKVCCLL